MGEVSEKVEQSSEATKVSKITAQAIAEYIHLESPSSEEINQLNTYLNVSKEFVKNYTGQKDLDKYPDFVIVIFILCQDMYDNRSLYVDKGNMNNVVQTILDMHSVNLL